MSPEELRIRIFGKSDSLEELTELLHRSYQTLAEMGLRYLATHLIEWYKKLGFRVVDYADWEVTNYRRAIMSKRSKET